MAEPNVYIPGQPILLMDVITSETKLALDITSTTATQVSLNGPIGPASGSFTIQIDNEQLTVTAGNQTLTLTVTRAINGTTAATHQAGATVKAFVDDASDAVTVYKPDLSTTTPAVSHPGLATYTAQVTPGNTETGWWEYVWGSTNTGPGKRRGRFYVSPVP